MQTFWILLLAVQIMYACADFITPKTYYEQRMYGEQLIIRLSSGAEKLQFTYMDEIEQEILWSRSIKAKRGVVTGRNDDRKFVIASVTFNDEGTYTVLNFWNRKSSIYFLKVITKTSSQDCVAGESLSIYLLGLPKIDATLHFSNQDVNLTLVERGSPVGSFHPDYMGRVKVTSSSIELLNVNVSDVGNYTLRDRLNRKVRIVSMNLVDSHPGSNAGPLAALLLLLGIPPCICCCCRKRICKKTSQHTTNTNTTTTVKYDNQINPPGPPPAYDSPAVSAGSTPGYPPSYPAVVESTVHPPPNPAFPPQPPYSGSPAMPPNPGHTPGYPPVGEGTVYPPPNPAFPPQPPHSGYPATSPAMPPNPNPLYPPGSGFPPAQPPQWSDAPSNQPPPAGFAPVMYNAPSVTEPVKGEILPTTPLLTPPQPEVARHPAPDSAIQFSINQGNNSSSNFLYISMPWH